MAKKDKHIEPMLEESSDEILMEETTSEETLLEESSNSETLLEESGESEVLLKESSDEVLLEESADSKTPLEEVDEKKRKAEEEEKKRKAEEAKRRKEEEEKRRQAKEAEVKAKGKKEKNRKIILFSSCIISSVSALVCVSFMSWESMGWYSILFGAFIALFVGVGTLAIIVGDEKQWKAILFRSVFALVTFGLMIRGFTGGSGGLSDICGSIFTGLFCTGFVMPFCKPSYFE